VNAFQVAVVQRLQRAGLLQVAERAAKRIELRLADCIAPGEVTGGHVALWKALAKEGQTPGQIADLVGFPATEVTPHLPVPAPRVTPAPESGPRAKALPLPVEAMPAGVKNLRALEQRFNAFSRRLQLMTRIGERARQLAYDLRAARSEIATLRTEVAALKGTVANLTPATILDAADREAEQHLARFGAAADVVRAEAVHHQIRVHEILNGKPSRGRLAAPVNKARRAIIATLTTDARFGWSQPQIAAVMRMNPSSIYYWQQELGIGAAHLPGLKGEPRKAAA
jgi:hypothetical protein